MTRLTYRRNLTTIQNGEFITAVVNIVLDGDVTASGNTFSLSSSISKTALNVPVGVAVDLPWQGFVSLTQKTNNGPACLVDCKLYIDRNPFDSLYQNHLFSSSSATYNIPGVESELLDRIGPSYLIQYFYI